MHAVIHNQLLAPQFKNLIKNGFIQARITNETIGHIEKPKDVCFKFYDLLSDWRSTSALVVHFDEMVYYIIYWFQLK